MTVCRAMVSSLLLFLCLAGHQELGGQPPMMAQLEYKGSTLKSGISDMEIIGNHAVCAIPYGLLYLNLLDPASPQIHSFHDLPYGGGCIKIDGNYAYMDGGEAGLVILNLGSLNENPVIIDTCHLGSPAQDIEKYGNYIYAAAPHGLQIVDISNIYSPVLVSSNAVAAGAVDLAVEGSLAYVAAGTAGFKIIRVLDPSNPDSVGFCNIPSCAVAVDDTLAYIGSGWGWGALQVINIKDPSNPVSVSEYMFYGSQAIDIIKVEHLVYLAMQYDGFHIINVNNPWAPSCLGICDSVWHIRCLEIHNNNAYISSAGDGLVTVDILSPFNPHEVGTNFQLGGSAGQSIIDNNHAYIAGHNGIYIIDIASDYAPFVCGSYNGAQNPTDIALASNYLYALDYYIL